MLWHAGVQTVLPPGYLCCGYPQRGSGQFDKAEKMITDNRVLFHRVANTLNYLDIKTVVVSCGTCYDQLQGYKFEDLPRLPHRRHPRVPAGEGHQAWTGRAAGYLYHDPCHSPMKQQDADEDRARPAWRGSSRASAALPAGPERVRRRLQNGLLEADYIVIEMAKQIPGRQLAARLRQEADDSNRKRIEQ